MLSNRYVLTITGSDNTGGAGIQADIRTIVAMGGLPLSAITSVTVQSQDGIHSMHSLPTDVVVGQVRASISHSHPKAIKVGMINDAETIRLLRDEVIACSRIVCVPGILSSKGERLTDDATLDAFCRYLIPETTLLILKCKEAEHILGMQINTDDDLVEAARSLCNRGSQWVMIRGSHIEEGRVTALLYSSCGMESAEDSFVSKPFKRFFSSYNIEGWQKHGVSGALSAAIATRLAYGDDVPTAIQKAHDYIHSQVVYAVETTERLLRPADIYNQFMSLIAANYNKVHDVSSYASMLSISARYLSQVTLRINSRSPKQIIDDYLFHEAQALLTSSRLNVQQISQHLGFVSQSSFSSFCRKVSGKTPSELRNI